jgi:hypothetical protein
MSEIRHKAPPATGPLRWKRILIERWRRCGCFAAAWVDTIRLSSRLIAAVVRDEVDAHQGPLTALGDEYARDHEE